MTNERRDYAIQVTLLLSSGHTVTGYDGHSEDIVESRTLLIDLLDGNSDQTPLVLLGLPDSDTDVWVRSSEIVGFWVEKVKSA